MAAAGRLGHPEMLSVRVVGLAVRGDRAGRSGSKTIGRRLDRAGYGPTLIRTRCSGCKRHFSFLPEAEVILPPSVPFCAEKPGLRIDSLVCPHCWTRSEVPIPTPASKFGMPAVRSAQIQPLVTAKLMSFTRLLKPSFAMPSRFLTSTVLTLTSRSDATSLLL